MFDSNVYQNLLQSIFYGNSQFIMMILVYFPKIDIFLFSVSSKSSVKNLNNFFANIFSFITIPCASCIVILLSLQDYNNLVPLTSIAYTRKKHPETEEKIYCLEKLNHPLLHDEYIPQESGRS